jgi:hypothetical protein
MVVVMVVPMGSEVQERLTLAAAAAALAALLLMVMREEMVDPVLSSFAMPTP